MTYKKSVGFILFLMTVLQPLSLLAEPPISERSGFRGKVLKFKGDAEVINAKGEVRTIKQINETLKENDTIVTKQGARVVVQFNDGVLSVLDEKSRLRVEQTSWFSYLGGKIYFTFKKVFGEPRRIKTRAATLGIRGTTFIVSENAEQTGEFVALQEGVLDIESRGPAFEIHKQKQSEDFEKFKQQHQQAKAEMNEAFNEYKKKSTDEFIEYKRKFTMQPDRVINLSGYRVDEKAMDEKNKADFASFEAEAELLLKAFREQVK